MWSVFRVPPPKLQPSNELRWVLLRGFAPPATAVPYGIDAATVVRLSLELDLAPRIATRHSAILVQELGSESARELSVSRLQALAINRVLQALRYEVLNTARSLSCPIIWLKHAALSHAGLIDQGERFARDVDLLVPEPSASSLRRALSERGFRSGADTPQYHLPPLHRASGEVIEIHTALWGVQLPGDAPEREGLSATRLISEGWVDSLADGSFVPKHPILAAHAVVHGLVQHRTSPEGYPIMRVLSDLCSLSAQHEASIDQGLDLVAFAVGRELSQAARHLSTALSHGRDVFSLSADSPERQLLSHLVASAIDPEYRRALRFERVLDLTNRDAIKRALRSAISSSSSVGSSAERSGKLRDVSSPLIRSVELALELARGAASFGELHVRHRR